MTNVIDLHPKKCPDCGCPTREPTAEESYVVTMVRDLGDIEYEGGRKGAFVDLGAPREACATKLAAEGWLVLTPLTAAEMRLEEGEYVGPLASATFTDQARRWLECEQKQRAATT